MQFTDSGKKIEHDWMPLAAANGAEWMELRHDFPDRFCNLYRGANLNSLLWLIGAFCKLAMISFRNAITR